MRWALFLIGLLSFGQGIPFNANGMVHAAAASYSGPGDVITTNWLSYWGLQAFTAANRGQKIANVCDSGDAHCVDMLSDATTGNAVVPSSNPNCGSSACTVKILYDQTNGNLCFSGAACDLQQATEALRPTLMTSCSGSLVCLTFTSSQTLVATVGALGYNIAYNQPISYMALGQRTGNFTTTQYLLSNPTNDNCRLFFQNSTNTITAYAGNSVNETAADSSFHIVQAAFNSASSTINVDGTAFSSLDLSTIGIGQFTEPCIGCASMTGQMFGAGILNADKSANFAAMSTNQRAYWGF